jgi:outer membrane protein assembly factor BamA
MLKIIDLRPLQQWKWLLSIWLLCSCSATSYLPEGEAFYDGAEIEFNTAKRRVGRKKALREELLTYVPQKPNRKIFGARPSVWFYYVAGTPEKEKGLRHFIKTKLGKPPVLMKDIEVDRTAKILTGQLFNEGYFESTVSGRKQVKRKAGKAVYTVELYRPYRLRNIHFPHGRDSTYAAILSAVNRNTYLKAQQRYDLARMQAEQARIEREVENYGFYYFDDRYLIFEADSTVGKKQVDLDLILEKGIPDKAKRIYGINEVTVIPYYSITRDTSIQQVDTIKVNGYNYIDSKHNFRPEIITRNINLKHGDTYSREAQELTLSHLMDLGNFKFVNIKFRDVSKDSSLLDSYIYLTPLKKKSIRAEVQAVSKSNNFVGPGVSFTFTNRNFLRGAELFQLKLSSSYEVQVSRKLQTPLNAFELGFESSLTVPRFISPIKIDYHSKKFLPKTQFRLGLNVQNRVSYFRLNSFSAGYGYNWRESASRSHELFPIDLNFVKTDKTSAAFDTLLRTNPVLANSFENQFIIGTRYSFTLNTQMREDPFQKYGNKQYKEHSFYMVAGFDVAGNLIHAVQRQVKDEEQQPYKLLGAPYSQYVKGDVDFRYYWQIDAHNKIVARIMTGVGYSYGNSRTLPYIKQYAIGGSNSIRAFPARSVGPGAYNVRTDTAFRDKALLFIDQRGDIKIESNLEYRFDIINFLKGALFVDAGNIWLIRGDSTRQGAKFDKTKFMNQIAVGTGFGLRFDFSFFVLRFDIAWPLRRNDTGWVVKDIDFASSRWRGDNLIFNIAIGYPF